MNCRYHLSRFVPTRFASTYLSKLAGGRVYNTWWQWRGRVWRLRTRVEHFPEGRRPSMLKPPVDD